MKCGYVAVLGQPNAGKSSLVNFLVGEEVAIVSHRRQTTRNSILGIKNGQVNGQKFQIVFVDTPGIHHSKNNLDKFMMKNVRSSLGMADVVLYLFDGSKDMEDEEVQYIEKLQKEQKNLILLCTKADKAAKRLPFEGLKVSVVSGQNMPQLVQKILEMLPQGQAMFDDEQYTDKSVKFLIAEKIRGQLLQMLDKEIPHGVAVVVTRFQEEAEKTEIDAEIVCERVQHKGIIIGKGGQNLKEIGLQTRLYAQQLLGQKIVLKLFVKVDENWRNKNVQNYYN